jgi:hypothetical protein
LIRGLTVRCVAAPVALLLEAMLVSAVAQHPPASSEDTEWSAAVWTSSSAAQSWDPLAKQLYCDRFAERLAKRWGNVGSGSLPVFLRAVVDITGDVTVDALPSASRWNPSAQSLTTVELLVAEALPLPGPPMSPSRRHRTFFLRLRPTHLEPDQRALWLAFGPPDGMFPKPAAKARE